MILKTVLIRFYKSFNFDYLRKHHPKAKSDAWEMMEKLWYPFVSIPIEPTITTVVGANESGKSHLLSAIDRGLSGDGLRRRDFCRYSQFFTVQEGKMRLPDFGFEFTGVTQSESETICAACSIQPEHSISSFLFFRFNGDKAVIYLPKQDGTFQVHDVQSEALNNVLPKTFGIDAGVALPSSVPIKWLGTDEDVAAEPYEALGREGRSGLFDALLRSSALFKTEETVKQSAPSIFSTFSPFVSKRTAADEREQAHLTKQYNLARDLIRKVAKIDKAAIEDLHRAIREGNDGHANGIIEKINMALSQVLNFPKWWAQDRDFSLTVSPREHDLAFTIRDRTATDYSFGERSAGLKYFLSYYVQYLAHVSPANRKEILLMDEPDAFLSAQAQQDLLRIFDGFAGTDDGRPAVQVIYVTHSPFLIDKNHASRIRVLEKGSGDEGTRVIRNASKNHYEPLRSAFGAFVGETAFIGNCNLMVEGTADQVLLGGAATALQQLGATDFETLDLNKITIVPAGSASHIPYMVFLARGRDVEQPAVIVLLDSDGPGETANRELKRGGPRGKQLVKKEYVLRVGDLQDKITTAPSGANAIWEIEDLIPLPICVEAGRRYIKEYCEQPDWADQLSAKSISNAMVEGESVFKAMERCFRQIDADLHLDKIGFARQVGETVVDLIAKEKDGDALRQYGAAMRVLFRRLASMQRAALKELLAERVSRRVERARDSFLKDYPNGARREQVAPLLGELDGALDDTPEGDAIRIALHKIRRDYGFDEDLSKPVPEYGRFVADLKRISYAGVLANDRLADERTRIDVGAQQAAAIMNATTEAQAPLAATKLADSEK